MEAMPISPLGPVALEAIRCRHARGDSIHVHGDRGQLLTDHEILTARVKQLESDVRHTKAALEMAKQYHGMLEGLLRRCATGLESPLALRIKIEELLHG